MVLGASIGFVVGAAIGFATAGDHIGVPPLLGALGLLLGLGLAGTTRITELRRDPRVRRSSPAPARAPQVSASEAPAVGESVGADDRWVVPPGWYPDPRGTQPTRYWDGAAWTEQVAESVPS